MSEHLFSVGELVSYASPERRPSKGDNVFKICLRMPPVGTELQYRIKSLVEPYERVVTEDRLSRLGADDAAG